MTLKELIESEYEDFVMNLFPAFERTQDPILEKSDFCRKLFAYLVKTNEEEIEKTLDWCFEKLKNGQRFEYNEFVIALLFVLEKIKSKRKYYLKLIVFFALHSKKAETGPIYRYVERKMLNLV